MIAINQLVQGSAAQTTSKKNDSLSDEDKPISFEEIMKDDIPQQTLDVMVTSDIVITNDQTVTPSTATVPDTEADLSPGSLGPATPKLILQDENTPLAVKATDETRISASNPALDTDLKNTPDMQDVYAANGFASVPPSLDSDDSISVTQTNPELRPTKASEAVQQTLTTAQLTQNVAAGPALTTLSGSTIESAKITVLGTSGENGLTSVQSQSYTSVDLPAQATPTLQTPFETQTEDPPRSGLTESLSNPTEITSTIVAQEAVTGATRVHVAEAVAQKSINTSPTHESSLPKQLQSQAIANEPTTSTHLNSTNAALQPAVQLSQDMASKSGIVPGTPAASPPLPSDTKANIERKREALPSSITTSPVATTVSGDTTPADASLTNLLSDSDAEVELLDGMADDLLPLTRGHDFNTLPQMLTEASVRSSSATYGAETPRLIGQQLAEAVVTHDGDQVDVALNPAELGKVNMRLTTTDIGVMIVIQAERPETEDLMRRHINELMKEFKEMGFTDIGFEFSDGSGTSHSNDTSSSSDGAEGSSNTEDDYERMPEELLAQLNITADGLDIRV